MSAETPPLKEDLKMGKLTMDEIVALSPDIIALMTEVKRALEKNESGESKVTRAEMRALRTSVLKLASSLAREALD
jgi:sensor histidine kinase YesM